MGDSQKHAIYLAGKHFWPWLVLAPAVWAQGPECPVNNFQQGALVVSIANPYLAEGPRKLPFAEGDADQVEKAFRALNFSVFRLKEASTARLSNCLDDLVRYANPDGTIVVFISGRGFSSSDMTDGFILTAHTAIDKLPGKTDLKRLASSGPPLGAGISLVTLRRKMQLTRTQRRYLLLDLCRDPAERKEKVDNLINTRVLEKGFLEGTRRVILASSGGKPSFESHYANALTELLRQRPKLTLEDLFKSLQVNVVQKSGKKQEPSRPGPAANDGWKERLTSEARRAPGALLAALTPAAMFWQVATPGATPEERENRRAAIAAEEAGQSIFVRYGEGNHFHGDPFHQCETSRPGFERFRLCQAEFASAARNFQEAAKLYRALPSPDTVGDQLRQIDLLEKARFCEAQALLLRPATYAAERKPNLEKAARNLEQARPFRLAESHNLLGIAYLELARYAEAQDEFRAAIGEAPHWAYPRHNLALTLVEQGDYTGAEGAYGEAIAKTLVGERSSDTGNPCFGKRKVEVAARPYLYYNLAVLLQRLNRLAEAQKQFCLAEVSFGLQSEILKEQGDIELAKLRQEAAKINLADVNNSLGVLFESRNQHGRAKGQFDQALANNPQLSAAAFNQARLAVKTRNPAEARRLYQQVLATTLCREAPDLACKAAESALKDLPR